MVRLPHWKLIGPLQLKIWLPVVNDMKRFAWATAPVYFLFMTPQVWLWVKFQDNTKPFSDELQFTLSQVGCVSNCSVFQYLLYFVLATFSTVCCINIFKKSASVPFWDSSSLSVSLLEPAVDTTTLYAQYPSLMMILGFMAWVLFIYFIFWRSVNNNNNNNTLYPTMRESLYR